MKKVIKVTADEQVPEIEPGSPASKANALSIGPRSHLKYRTRSNNGRSRLGAALD